MYQGKGDRAPGVFAQRLNHLQVTPWWLQLPRAHPQTSTYRTTTLQARSNALPCCKNISKMGDPQVTQHLWVVAPSSEGSSQTRLHRHGQDTGWRWLNPSSCSPPHLHHTSTPPVHRITECCGWKGPLKIIQIQILFSARFAGQSTRLAPNFKARFWRTAISKLNQIPG